jgi:hypothetical protein
MERDLEKTFYDRQKRFTTSLVLGNRHSGKSVLCASLLWNLLDDYDEILLVLQGFHTQANGTWNFLNNLPPKQAKKIKVYTSFDMEIIHRLIETASKDNKARYLFVDDCTNIPAFFQSQNEAIKRLFTCCRHLRCSITLVYHALNSNISRTLRSNIEFYVITRNLDEKLLSSLFEETVSLLTDKRTFLASLKDKMMDTEYPGILLHADTGAIDYNVSDWDSIQRGRKHIMKYMTSGNIRKPKKEDAVLPKPPPEAPKYPNRNPFRRTKPSISARIQFKPIFPKTQGKKITL